MDVASYALAALMRTLKDELPGRLSTLDASRIGKVVCPPGPYTIPASGGLVLNGVAVSLTAGSRTAAQVAVEINATVGITVSAAADADGRLEISAPSAPAAAVASEVRIDEATANEALGLAHGDGSLVLALGARRMAFLERAWRITDGVPRPTLSLETFSTARRQPVRLDLEPVQLRLLLLFPGMGSEAATQEAVRAIASELADVVADGDGRGPHLVGGETYGESIELARVTSVRLEPTAAQFGSGNLFVAAAHIDVEIGVYNP